MAEAAGVCQGGSESELEHVVFRSLPYGVVPSPSRSHAHAHSRVALVRSQPSHVRKKVLEEAERRVRGEGFKEKMRWILRRKARGY